MKNLIKNVRLIDEHNEKFKKGKSKFKMAKWGYSDESTEDFLSNFTGYKGRPKFRSRRRDFDSENVPESLNYVDEGLVFPKVFNQGYCGCKITFF